MSVIFEIDNNKLIKYSGSDTEIVIPDGVIEIEKGAFENNKELVSVSMPDSVVKIGSRAFQGCSKLKTITLSNNITEIGYSAFSDCLSLKEVKLPNSLQSLGEGAFGGCKKLVKLTIDNPDFVTYEDPFYDMYNYSLKVADKDGFIIFGKTLFKYVGESNDIVVPDGVERINNSRWINYNVREKIKSVILPDSMKHIGMETFYNMTKLKSIQMPNHIEIERSAFDGCVGLADENGFFVHHGKLITYMNKKEDISSITLPEGIEIIGAGVFAGCNLKKLTLVNSIKKIEANAFYECEQLEEIILSKKLEEIGESVFEKCTHLKSIIIPDCVKRIGSKVFAGCKQLNHIVLPETIEFLGDNLFTGCKSLVDEKDFINIHNRIDGYYGTERKVVIPEGIDTISDNAFSNTSITSIQLPSTLKRLGSAFRECAFLTKIVIPEGVEEIKDYSFENCIMLEEVVLPSTLKQIGYHAFNHCEKLKKIDIPEGVEEIKKYSFENCIMLEEVVLPSTLKQIGYHAFNHCEKLKKIDIPDSVTNIGDSAFYGCENLTSITIPDSVTNIGDRAFANCISLKSISIPSGVKELNCAFGNCSSLASVKLNEGLIKIDYATFAYCKKLKEITIPSSVTLIGQSAFEGCSSLKTVKYDREDHSLEIKRNAFKGCKKLSDENGMVIMSTILITYTGKNHNPVIPEGITRILENAFSEEFSREMDFYPVHDYGFLNSVVLPSTIKYIDKNAFKGCWKLKSINFPEGLEYIGMEAFKDCKNLKSIQIPSSMQTIKMSAFDGCNHLSKVDIKNGLKTIESNTFCRCELLKEILIPASVQTINDLVFARCNNLKKIDVDPDNTMFAIQDGILVNKSKTILLKCPPKLNLTSYEIPKNITEIASHAFEDCKALKKIVIGSHVTTLGSFIFNTQLNEIEVDPNAGSKKIGKDVFGLDGVYGVTLIYPKLPVTLINEQGSQIRLGSGYCINPEKYEGVYADIYEKYVESHEKSLRRNAVDCQIKKVIEYLDRKQNKEVNTGYVPNLKIKNPSDLLKVETLEEVIQKGTLQDLEAVLTTYKPFEFTARALGIAARYRGLEYVKLLMEHGATFDYDSSSQALQRKYTVNYNTVAGRYKTEYYLMIIEDKITFNRNFKDSYLGDDNYAYTPMYGAACMTTIPTLKPLSIEKRIEIAQFFKDNKQLGVSMDEMLFWALTTGKIKFADALIDMGVTLQEDYPNYYSSNNSYTVRKNEKTYVDIIIEGNRCVYWNDYVTRLVSLNENDVFDALKRFYQLTKDEGELLISQKMFDDIKWNNQSLEYILKNTNIKRINQKNVLESIVARNQISSLELLTNLGWLENAKRRESILAYARDNNYIESFTWLLDYKGKTVDLVAEAAKEEAKLLKELNENPNSVSALKKIWSYTKLEDGTLMITSYKGTSTEIEVPAYIGKTAVTRIGTYAFSAFPSSYKKIVNEDTRKQITSVTIPEGIKIIDEDAFYDCKSLTTVKLPKSLTSIRRYAFEKCQKLKTVYPLANVKNIDSEAFLYCSSLRDNNGFIVIDGVLTRYEGKKTSIKVPDGVKRIIPFCDVGWDSQENIKEIILPEGLEQIDDQAFAKFSYLKSISIPKSVRIIGNEAFAYSGLRAIEFHDGINQIGKEIFGENNYYKLNQLTVFAPAGSKIEEYMKNNYKDVVIINDSLEK